MARRRDASRCPIYRWLSGEKPKRTIVMITSPYRYLSRLVRRFQEHLWLKNAEAL